MQGVPLDGYWVCFDEVHLMRVLLQCASTLFNALKISRETVEINGDEVSFILSSKCIFGLYTEYEIQCSLHISRPSISHEKGLDSHFVIYVYIYYIYG